jgi:NAD dependent epimerase/dehydratase family enzyme
MIAHSLETPALSGAVNAVSPSPVTNAHFTKVLGEVLARPALLRVPAAALRLGIGELADALLSSQRAVPDRAVRSGFEFEFGDLHEALKDCLAS